MKFSISETDLKQFADCLYTFFKEGIVEVRIKNGGWEVRALDSARVAFFRFFLPSTFFSLYEYDSEKDYENININVESFAKFIKRVKGTINIQIDLQTNKMEISAEKTKMRRVTSLYSSPNYPYHDENYNLTEAMEIELDPDELATAIKDMRAILKVDYVEMRCKENQLSIIGHDRLEDTVEALIECEVTNLLDEEAVSSYDISYLLTMLTPAKNFDVMNIQFGKDSPISFNYKDESGDLVIMYVLAPKIEEQYTEEEEETFDE